ncbi:hypothetical protein [Sandarakinorhabdus sp.]|uniref:hypothetical protein n=1 Tax=Sandarakinorhabdus sp. TaxID=1916663 RepID=UPI003341A31C
MKLATILLAGTLVALGSPAGASSFTNGGFELLFSRPWRDQWRGWLCRREPKAGLGGW